MKKTQKLEKIDAALFADLTPRQIRQAQGGTIAVKECGDMLDFDQDS